jgi:hypothetical protein
MPLSNATVTVRSVTTTDDGEGNTSSGTTDTVLEWALVAPRASTERTDPRTPAVVTAASLLGPHGTVISAEALVIVADCGPSMDGDWQVEGRAGDWSLNGWQPGFEVALKRASSE